MRRLSLLLLLPLAFGIDDCDDNAAHDFIVDWAGDNGFENPYTNLCDYTSATCNEYRDKVWADYTDPNSCALHYCTGSCTGAWTTSGDCLYDEDGCVVGFNGDCTDTDGACCGECDNPQTNNCIQPPPDGCGINDHASRTATPIASPCSDC